MITKKVQKIVLDLCDKSDIRWRYHITSTVKYAKILGKKFGANLEVVELASWLHDIASIKGIRENHHVKGAEMAEEILSKMKCDKKIVKRVIICVRSHMDDDNFPRETIEQKVVASADAISDFDHFDLTCYRFFIRYSEPEEAREMILDKYEKAYLKIMGEAKYLIRPKLDAIRLLLKD